MAQLDPPICSIVRDRSVLGHEPRRPLVGRQLGADEAQHAVADGGLALCDPALPVREGVGFGEAGGRVAKILAGEECAPERGALWSDGAISGQPICLSDLVGAVEQAVSSHHNACFG